MKYAAEMNSLRCNNIHNRFHKDWFSHSEADRGGGMHRQHGDRICLL
jgi:hypothetical protein